MDSSYSAVCHTFNSSPDETCWPNSFPVYSGYKNDLQKGKNKRLNLVGNHSHLLANVHTACNLCSCAFLMMCRNPNEQNSRCWTSDFYSCLAGWVGWIPVGTLLSWMRESDLIMSHLILSQMLFCQMNRTLLHLPLTVSISCDRVCPCEETICYILLVSLLCQA